jgi:tetratricopeptide (TPR) repeat protein
VLPLVASVVIAALLWAGWRRWRSQPFAVGLLWLVLPLLPLLNLAVFPEGEMVHDRYLYLPSVGFSILVALAVRNLRPGSRRLFGQPAVQLGSVLGIALLLGAATARQTAFWATDLLLLSRAVEIAPGNVRARFFLANALLNRGDTELGIRLHQQLLERFPDLWYSNASLGIAYYGIGRYQDADRHLSRAIRTDPNADSSLFLYLGLTRMAEGDLSQAQASIEHAIRMDPGAPGYRLWLGEVMERRGDVARALELYRSEAALQPDNPEPRERAQRLAQRPPDRIPPASPAEKEP